MSEQLRSNQSVKRFGWLALCFVACASLEPHFSLAADDKVNEPIAKKKAVLEISKTDGFRLSEKATSKIGLATSPIESAPEFTIPENAVVHSLDILAVYRLREGWYKLIPVEVVRKKGAELVVRSPDIKSGSDRVVTRGIALLRATEMEAFGGEE